jgi:hypothetical protein
MGGRGAAGALAGGSVRRRAERLAERFAWTVGRAREVASVALRRRAVVGSVLAWAQVGRGATLRHGSSRCGAGTPIR